MPENLRIALEAIRINKMRSFLTMLGIIIGISSVIALISLGRGVESFIFNEFELLGSKRLSVTSAPPEAETRVKIDPLTMEDVKALSNPVNAPNVGRVGAQYNVTITISFEGESTVTTARGYTANMDEVLAWRVEFGSYISQQNVENKDRVVVLGREIVSDLFGANAAPPLGAIVRINDQPFTVIGVMEGRSSAFGNENTAIVIPISTAQTRLQDAQIGNQMAISTLYVEAASNDVINKAEAEIDYYFYNKHGMTTEDERDYNIINPSTIQDAVRAITGLLTIFLGMIASISLIVGGIGIMNIMLVTVTERTREIGLRKAVGATSDKILNQFLIESVVLSLFGGIIGIIVGWLFSSMGSAAVEGLELSVQPDAILLATAVSSIVGIVFGILPARQAANMNPIDALRYE